MLARLLKADFLPTVWIPGEKERYVRELLAHRMRLVRNRTAVINELHAVYAKRNVEVPGMIWHRLRPMLWRAEELSGYAPRKYSGLPCLEKGVIDQFPRGVDHSGRNCYV